MIHRFSPFLVLVLAGSAAIARLDRPMTAAAPPMHDDSGAYDVLVETSQAGGGSTWTYTITKATNQVKDLGHFIVNFNNCGGQSPTLAHIVWSELVGPARGVRRQNGLRR